MSNVPDLTGDGPFRDPDEEVLSAELVDDDGEMSGRDNPFSALSAGGLGGGLDLGAMMQMAQDMGSKMAAAQEEMSSTEIEGTAGGGVVSVTLNGELRMVGVSIDPAAFDPDDPSMLEDLVVAAWTDAFEQVEKLRSEASPLAGLGDVLGGAPGGLGGLLGGT
jgi:nucleoid-associated protein EbfC